MTIEELYNVLSECAFQVMTDTRKIDKPGALFFALSGDQFNGNLFAEQAISKGCSYAVIDDVSLQKDDKYIVVDNVLSTMQELANYHRRRFDIPIIAITGSNGKTTTKELLNAMLSTQHKVLATQGNFNNHIGVPLTLLALRKEHTIGIVELGTNHPGEIRALAEIAEPTAALISSIGKAHLEGLGSLDGVAKEKLSLFDYTRENGGQLFANLESTYIAKYIEEHQVASVTYRTVESDSFSIKLEEVFPRIKGEVLFGDKKCTLNSSLFGGHNLLNISAALTVSKHYQLDLSECIMAINQLQLSNNRTETIQINDCTFYLDAYNANPSSMREAIQAFTSHNLTQKWLILGDMFELGKDEIAEHQDIVGFVQSEDWAKIVLVGQLFSQTNCPDSILQFSSFEELKDWFDRQDTSSKEILIKGSRGMGLERLIK